MIIKLTVNDNDFGILIDSFMDNLSSRIIDFPKDLEAWEDKNKQYEYIMNVRKVSKLMNPNVSEKHSKEDKEIIIDKVKESFGRYVGEKEPDKAKYLIDKLEVKIINSMMDKWENGEVWYWFQHSGKYINQ